LAAAQKLAWLAGCQRWRSRCFRASLRRPSGTSFLHQLFPPVRRRKWRITSFSGAWVAGDRIASAKETVVRTHVFFQPCAVSPPLLSPSLCPGFSKHCSRTCRQKPLQSFINGSSKGRSESLSEIPAPLHGHHILSTPLCILLLMVTNN
jgi:hypothetical protein